jgi:hypothetical protein
MRNPAFTRLAGSYLRIVALYTLVPLSSVIAFVLLALLQVFVYPLHTPDPYPHSKHLPFPLPELLVSASLWSLSHLLRMPIHSIFFTLTASPTPAILLSTFFHVVVHNLLRLAAFPLLLRHQMVRFHPSWHDPSFRHVWWIALGWSFAEVAVGVAQGYEQISLYRDVLIPKGKDEEFLQQWNGGSPASIYISPTIDQSAELGLSKTAHCKGKNAESPAVQSGVGPKSNGDSGMYASTFADTLEVQVDRDLDQLMALRGREELEEVYGIPAIVRLPRFAPHLLSDDSRYVFQKIPVFISCLLRLNSIIISLGLTLLLSASYLHSSISRTDALPPHLLHFAVQKEQVIHSTFYITLPIVVVLHLFLAILHTPLVLPRIGVHTSAYIGLLIGLGCLFAGLGVWEALS